MRNLVGILDKNSYQTSNLVFTRTYRNKNMFRENGDKSSFGAGRKRWVKPVSFSVLKVHSIPIIVKPFLLIFSI